MILPRRLAVPAALLSTAVLLLAAARPVGQSTEPTLDELMGKMRRQYKAASKGASDPSQNEATLKSLDEIEELILASKRLEPTNLSDVPSDARMDHIHDYRSVMARLLSEVALAEADLWHGDNEAAAKRLAGSVRDIREEGHEKFQPEDEH
jgi:soluble cytochrome b562